MVRNRNKLCGIVIVNYTGVRIGSFNIMVGSDWEVAAEQPADHCMCLNPNSPCNVDMIELEVAVYSLLWLLLPLRR